MTIRFGKDDEPAVVSNISAQLPKEYRSVIRTASEPVPGIEFDHLVLHRIEAADKVVPVRWPRVSDFYLHGKRLRMTRSEDEDYTIG